MLRKKPLEISERKRLGKRLSIVHKTTNLIKDGPEEKEVKDKRMKILQKERLNITEALRIDDIVRTKRGLPHLQWKTGKEGSVGVLPKLSVQSPIRSPSGRGGRFQGRGTPRIGIGAKARRAEKRAHLNSSSDPPAKIHRSDLSPVNASGARQVQIRGGRGAGRARGSDLRVNIAGRKAARGRGRGGRGGAGMTSSYLEDERRKMIVQQQQMADRERERQEIEARERKRQEIIARERQEMIARDRERQEMIARDRERQAMIARDRERQEMIARDRERQEMIARDRERQEMIARDRERQQMADRERQQAAARERQRSASRDRRQNIARDRQRQQSSARGRRQGGRQMDREDDMADTRGRFGNNTGYNDRGFAAADTRNVEVRNQESGRQGGFGGNYGSNQQQQPSSSSSGLDNTNPVQLLLGLSKVLSNQIKTIQSESQNNAAPNRGFNNSAGGFNQGGSQGGGYGNQGNYRQGNYY